MAGDTRFGRRVLSEHALTAVGNGHVNELQFGYLHQGSFSQQRSVYWAKGRGGTVSVSLLPARFKELNLFKFAREAGMVPVRSFSPRLNRCSEAMPPTELEIVPFRLLL
jgi:hypothetical protein